MLVDHEAVVADLIAFICEKPNHGQSQLLAKIAELQAKHRVDESVIEETLRRYGVVINTDLRAAARRDSRPNQQDDAFAQPMVDESTHQSDQHERQDDGREQHDGSAVRPERAAA